MDSSGKLTSRDATEMLNPKKKWAEKRATWLLFLQTHTPSNLRALDFSHANKKIQKEKPAFDRRHEN